MRVGLRQHGLHRFSEEAFYWSDIFHYRRTYQFPFVLFEHARNALAVAADDDARKDAEARVAFAVGWMSHCATDVTGHPFTNAKCGGPYRDHWQRHHLVCYVRDGERVFETYYTGGRGVEIMAPTHGLLDMTVYGRQERWEDSPDGWPQPWGDASNPEVWRTNGRPIAQWSRIEAGRSDELT